MADAYAVLARIYKVVGLNAESEILRERLFGKIQSEGWLGRRILELGCGVGDTGCWFSVTGFRVTAVDQSEAMLEVARQQAQEQGATVDWRLGDIRHADVGNSYDLVMCLNTLNETQSVRDLEQVFAVANRALSRDKLFIFDLVTLQGLVERWGNQDRVLYDDPAALTLAVRSHYNFETSVNTRSYIIYRQDGGQWHREDAALTLRGYSLQAVGVLLQRAGFKIQSVIDPTFASYDPDANQSDRAIFLAVKVRDLA
jgi:SAM-dependent methyltransferase